jgi:F-type H+-transporting ATPase subunit delta
MAYKTTIARPYAKAAFEEARADGGLAAWSDALHVAADVVGDARVQQLLGNPHVTPEELAQLIVGIAGERLGEQGRNFVLTLADNRRLECLPEIATLFDELKDAAQGVADVTVTSAVPLNEAQQGRLREALARRLKREVRLHCATDPSLIGGAVVRAGDLVIDGSLRARLERMGYELTV